MIGIILFRIFICAFDRKSFDLKQGKNPFYSINFKIENFYSQFL
jgi:hypothetical protein